MSRTTPPSRDTKVTLTGTYLGESAKAVRFKIKTISGWELEKPQDEWFPFSQTSKIHRAADYPDSESGDYLVVSEWICKQKKLFGEGDQE
jgi:hypothetical protein